MSILANTFFIDRDARLEEAEEVARRKHEERVKQEEAKFLAEEKDTIGDENVKLQQLEAETEGEKKQIEESFGKAKDQVTQMLLHFVTTCTVSLNENQRQAFLAIQRKDLEKTRKHTDD